MARSPYALAVLEATLIDDEQRCGECHTRQSEWGYYDAQGVFQPFPEERYELATDECWGCRRLHGERREDNPPRWKRWYLRRRRA